MAMPNCIPPVNISTTSKGIKKCTTCEYKFDFSNTSALKYEDDTTSNNIKINIDNISDRITFKGISLATAYFKIYRKSYHLFDGRQVDAELEIRQCGKNNTVLYTYIPILLDENGAGKTFDFFNKFLSQISPNTSGNINVGADWTLNDVVPSTNYYYYTTTNAKNNTIHNIVFTVENAAKISKEDFDYLTKIIPNNDQLKYTQDQINTAMSVSLPNCITLRQSVTNAKGPGYNAQYILSQCKEVSGVNTDDKEKKNEPSGTPITLLIIAFCILIIIVIFYLISRLVLWIRRQNDLYS